MTKLCGLTSTEQRDAVYTLQVTSPALPDGEVRLPSYFRYVSLDHCCLDTLCCAALCLAVDTGSCCLVQGQCYHLDSPALAVVDRGEGSPSSSTSLASTIAVLTLYSVWRCAWLPPLAHVASCTSTTTSECARPQWLVGEGSASSPTS